MTIVNTLDLDLIHLSSGGHTRDPNLPITEQEMCFMEAVSYVAGEKWSAAPECASKVIGSFMVRWNDSTDDEGRQALKPYIYRLVGTKGTKEQEDARAFMAAD